MAHIDNLNIDNLNIDSLNTDKKIKREENDVYSYIMKLL